jgi:ATP-dependent helicase/nuclease subunit A
MIFANTALSMVFALKEGMHLSKIKYSPNQLFAIEKTEQSLVLSAGAGAGKTGVLVQRYLQLLKEHKSHDAIVAITFTRKAAAEMRERIGAELLGRLQEGQDKKEAEVLQQQILLLPTANISTIHGFCSKILRSFPIEAGIDPDFTLLEEFESRQILQNCITQELAGFLQNHNHQAMFLLQNSNTSRLQNDLGDFLSKAIGKGLNLKDLLLGRPLSLNEREELWQNFFQILSLLASSELGLDKRGRKALRRRDFLLTMEEKSAHDFYLLDHHQQGKFFQSIADTFLEYEKGSSLSKNDGILFDFLNDLQFFETYQSLWEDWLQTTYEKVYVFLNAVYDRFSREKKRVKALDFGDLEHLTLQLLEENPQIVAALEERYLSYLVDEFQDTNYSQFEIIKLLNANRMDSSLFVAGDIKQSIYGFRGAVVQLFLNMTQLIDQSVDADTQGHKVLQANYRSAPQIIDLVNAYFSDILPDYQPMNKGRSLPVALPAAEIIINTRERSGESRLEEARGMAQRMREMVDNKEKLTFKRVEGQEVAKAVEFRDIAMLFRSRSALNIYVQALKKENIPYLVIGNRAFYQREEIRFIILALAAIAQPDNEFAIWGWFSAPYHGLALSDLAEYALYCRKNNLNLTDHLDLEKFTLWQNEGKKASKEKLNQLISNLKNWQNLKMFLDVPQLIERIIRDSSLDTFYAAAPLGEQAWTNIAKLISISKEASGTKYNGIHEALAYFQNLAEEENEAELTLFSEHQNAVRIMTIHAAKGLEFPVLFLPDLIRQLRQRVEDSLLYSPQEGLTLKLGTRKGHKLVDEALNLEKEEAQRVFYVALTRARDYLVLGGALNKYEKRSYWAQFLEWLKASEQLPSLEEIEAEPAGLKRSYHDLEFLWRYFPEENLQEEERVYPRFDPDLDLEDYINQLNQAKQDLTDKEKNLTKAKDLISADEPHALELNNSFDETTEKEQADSKNISDEFSEVNPENSQLSLFAQEAEENLSLENLEITPLQEEIDLTPREEFRVSATALLEYKQCPRRYYLRYRLWLKPFENLQEDFFTYELYDRLEEEGNEVEKAEINRDDPLIFGSLIHYLCENLDLHSDGQELIDQALELEEFSSQAHRRDEAFEIYQKIREDQNLVDLLEKAESIDKELKFLIPLSENTFLEGIIDLVLKNSDDTLTILDYKTNRVNANTIDAVANQYILQLQWYALALQEEFSSKVEEAHLYFTRLPKIWPVNLAEEDLNQAKTQLLELSKTIETGKNKSDFIKKIDQHCKYCPYLQVC